MDPKKSLKNTKVDDPQNSRLESLRLPRDLSLGGTKPKKLYVPNVNVVRNKDKPREVLRKLDKKRTDRQKTHNKSKNVGGNLRFVQSSGIFSEGAGESRKSNVRTARAHVTAETEGSSAIPIPTYEKYSWTVDKQRENIVLEELVNYDADDSDDEKMPLHPIVWKKKPKDAKIENIVPCFNKMKYDDENLGLSIVKLPDTLSGKGLSDDPNVKKLFDYPMEVMLEGKIGTLQIRRSGKMQIKLGHIMYNLEPTDFYNYNEEIATVDDPAAEHPKLAILGNIQKRFLISPIWNCLLEKS